MKDSIRAAMKQLIGDVNREARNIDRNLLLRTAAAMGSAYHASQAEYARNASIPVKYAVLDRFGSSPGSYWEHGRYDELHERLGNAKQPAYYRGLQLAVPMDNLTHHPGERLIKLLDVELKDMHLKFSCYNSKVVRVEETIDIWLPTEGADIVSNTDLQATRDRLVWMLLA